MKNKTRTTRDWVLIVIVTIATVVLLALCSKSAKAGPAEDSFVNAMQAFTQSHSPCSINDCECWMQRVAQKKQVSNYAQQYLTESTQWPALARVARAWIDSTNTEYNYWSNWQCTSDDRLTWAQRAQRASQQEQIIDAMRRLNDELEQARQSIMQRNTGL